MKAGIVMKAAIAALLLSGVVVSEYADVVSIDDANAARIITTATETQPNLVQFYILDAGTFRQKIEI